MKAILATVTVIVSLLGARLVAADVTPTTIPVEQQFQQADLQLAIEQYMKLRMAAFDIDLKFLTETTQTVVLGQGGKGVAGGEASFHRTDLQRSLEYSAWVRKQRM